MKIQVRRKVEYALLTLIIQLTCHESENLYIFFYLLVCFVEINENADGWVRREVE